jgi:hypothetical protein
MKLVGQIGGGLWASSADRRCGGHSHQYRPANVASVMLSVHYPHLIAPSLHQEKPRLPKQPGLKVHQAVTPS